MASDEWATQAVAFNITQVGESFNGSWAISTNVWTGTISGTVDSSRMTATMSLVWGFCNGAAQGAVSGSAGGTTMRWSSPGFTGNCREALPTNVVFNLQRP